MEEKDFFVPCKDGFGKPPWWSSHQLGEHPDRRGMALDLMEDFDVTTAEKEGTFDSILKVLDQHFEYNSRAQVTADFDAYFGLSRKSGRQSMEFVTLHSEHLKRLAKHDVDLPNAVQGWHLLRRCNHTKEQKQLITLRAPQLEISKVTGPCILCLGRTTSTRPKLVSMTDVALRRVVEAVAMWLWMRPTLKSPTTTMGIVGMMNGDTMRAMMDHLRTMVAMMMNGMKLMNLMLKPPTRGASGDPPEAVLEDVDTYDEVYAAYVDARRRFSDLKLASRGRLEWPCGWQPRPWCDFTCWQPVLKGQEGQVAGQIAQG